MKFNKFILAFIAMFAMVFGALGGDTNSAPSVSPFKANEFAVSTFGTYQASGTVAGDSQWGVGVQADYFVTKNFGVALSTSKNTFDEGPFFQNLTLGPVIRLPIKSTRIAPYAMGGVGFAFDANNDRYWYAGGGVEYRVSQHVGAFADGQYVWRDYLPDDSEAVLVRLGVRWIF